MVPSISNITPTNSDGDGNGFGLPSRVELRIPRESGDEWSSVAVEKLRLGHDECDCFLPLLLQGLTPPLIIKPLTPFKVLLVVVAMAREEARRTDDLMFRGIVGRSNDEWAREQVKRAIMNRKL
jgi:hypothetical protein